MVDMTVFGVVGVALYVLQLFTDLLGVLPAGIGGLVVGIGGLGIAAGIAAPLVGTLAASVWGLSAALLANPVGLALVGAALAVVAIRMTATAAATSTSTDDMIDQINTLKDHRRALLANKDILTGTVASAAAYGTEPARPDTEIAKVTSALHTQVARTNESAPGLKQPDADMAAARAPALRRAVAAERQKF